MDAGHQFALLLKDIFRLWRTEIDRRLEPLGLSQAQWQPLLMLYRCGKPMTQAELAVGIDVESPTLVRLLDRLGEKGWIERRPCPGDRRAHHVHLTPQAQRLCEQIGGIVEQTRADLLDGASEAELKRCIELLGRLKQRALEMQSDELAPATKKPPAKR